MNLQIKLLDEVVANQIAAGEVVERPASVVKELVENSLDAGATSVTVVVSDGGRSLIQIMDDGHGMDKDDALLAVERFATSKLNTADELQRISTFGFRGEALPSIASVSRFTLETSAGRDGTEVVIVAGKKERVSDKARSRGTTITVRDLFFNVPARRSFLRSEKSELALIRTVLGDFGVSHPEVRFSLVSDGAEIFVLPAQKGFPLGDRCFAEQNIGGRGRSEDFIGFRNRVREIRLAGDDPLECSAEVESSGGTYRMFGLLTKPLDCVSGAGKLRLLVNGRAVRDKILLRAIRDGYGNFLRGDKFPAGVVHLFAPPAEIDVNVHPQKAEVRYRSPDKIFSVVRQGIGVSLRAGSTASSGGTFVENFSDNEFPQPLQFSEQLRFDSSKSYSPGERELILPQIPKEIPLTEYRLVGQIFSCYLLLEHPAGLFTVVDMHAAHERIMFAKFKREWVEGTGQSQSLLIPESVDIPSELRADSEEIKDLLEAIGYELDLFDNGTLVIRAVPALLSRFSTAGILSDLLSQFSFRDVEGALERKIDAVISRIACHRSVRSGQDLSVEESYSLLEDLENTELRAFCPHGRSVARVLSIDEIERLFGRAE